MPGLGPNIGALMSEYGFGVYYRSSYSREC